MGDQNFLHLSVGGQEITAAVPGEYEAEEGTNVLLRFPENSVHLFATDSGEALLNWSAVAHVFRRSQTRRVRRHDRQTRRDRTRTALHVRIGYLRYHAGRRNRRRCGHRPRRTRAVRGAVRRSRIRGLQDDVTKSTHRASMQLPSSPHTRSITNRRWPAWRTTFTSFSKSRW